MGKSLKGKELGVGISQRKDGLYTARFTDRQGKRRQKYFKKLQECRNWLADMQFQDGHGAINAFEDMTVSDWFDYWIENIKGNAKYNTINSYKYRFKQNILPCIGRKLLTDIKPLHCQDVLNQMMLSDYKVSTINLARVAMKVMFDDAVENELIAKNPVTKSVRCNIQDRESEFPKAMTVKEQRTFTKEIKKYNYYYQYAFVLQTGLRVGELTGLKWSDIDFDKKYMHVSRTLNYVNGNWIEGTTKSKSGVRDIPLTEDAITILNQLKGKRKTSDIIPMQYHDFIFVSSKGTPIPRFAYFKNLNIISSKIGIPHISMHTLRHTFATRCAEAGMQPKTLQIILGHSSIDVTMNVYVHVMDDIKANEIKNIESLLRVTS